MKHYWLKLNNLVYVSLLSKIIFLFNSELMHDLMTIVGEQIGKVSFLRKMTSLLFKVKSPVLKQKLNGIVFENPIGLAAGFDYEARLTQILPSIGFGFETIGTITNLPYEGNPKPRLARLLKSKSLMVNKGFKNQGINEVNRKLRNQAFDIPIGMSIGQTNTAILSQKEAVNDIIKTFKKAEDTNLKIKYYELNISCPNLSSTVDFYDPLKLDLLLKAVKKLNIKKPIFIKMPIDKKDKEVLAMLNIIIKNKFTTVIFGNLQKDRKNKELNKKEIAKYPAGNFSGKPTLEASNHLISLTYKNYKDKLIIIGCGGIFNAEDAYRKIKLGASLVQFITGLIFEGPTLAASINSDLIRLLEKDGYKNINQVIGKDNMLPSFSYQRYHLKID